MLKQAQPDLIVAQFWHIPWPNREIVPGLPLAGGAARRPAGQRPARLPPPLPLPELPRHGRPRPRGPGRHGALRGHARRPHDAGPAVPDQHRLRAPTTPRPAAPRSSARPTLAARELRLREGRLLGVGIERLDYTKGIPERLRALDRLLRDATRSTAGGWPSSRSACPAARTSAAYQQLDEEMDALVEQINWRWGTDAWRPIVYLKRALRRRST